MLFSPIAERSLKVRLFYGLCYALLSLGAITIIAPLLVMLTGSLSPTTARALSIFPDYLLDEKAFWQGYLTSKYNHSPTLLRQAWGKPNIDFQSLEIPKSEEVELVKLWNEFQSTASANWILEGCGFFGTPRLPQYNGRKFREWLMERFDGDLQLLNRELGTEFANRSMILPPRISVNGSVFDKNPLGEKFLQFVREEVELSQRIVMNCGGYYRAVFLPQVVGHDIKTFNQAYNTNYHSYSEVPFNATVPAVGAEHWFTFVSRILRPDFVQFTESGIEHFEQTSLSKEEFIRRVAKPEDLKVRSLDIEFVEWGKSRGLIITKIPQESLDWNAFQEQKIHWRNVFLTQNYAVVLDEILVHGRALGNTLILVVLSVAGTLIVNPMAAYALSRYKPRCTYQILLFCLLTLALPGEVTMIPIFLQLKEMGLLNTFGALIIPGLANGFSIFLLKGFFDSLPRELYEAAELDGASEFTIFWQLTMNLSRPILAVLALGAFTSAYGTFMYALILCPDPKMWTIMVYLFQLMQKMSFPVLYAALIVASIPTILIFVFCQNIILRGIVIPSEK